MVSNSTRWSSSRALARVLAVAALLFAGGIAASACGGASPPSATSTVGATTGSCTGVSGAHHARLVVEPSAGKVVARCVGFSGSGLPALKLIAKSRLEVGTQTFSFGVAICQVDNVPAHYSKCLPTGQDYWALFLSKNGRTWTSPPVGVSDITVPAGGSLGLRYDPPTGKPAPPPHPSPA